MNAVSDIDAKHADREDNPDIILGEDWDRSAADAADSGIRPAARRSWLALNSSPLARKIITFNLLALIVMVAGVLYLNPFRDSLVRQVERSLVTDARLIASVFEAELPAIGPINMQTGDGIDVAGTLNGLRVPPGTEVFIFDARSDLVARAAADVPLHAGKGGTLLTGLIADAWNTISNALGVVQPEADPDAAQTLARNLLQAALSGDTTGKSLRTQADAQMFAVATPITRDGVVVGAVALATAAGEIDHIMRQEREQVLQMFVIAILVSVGLSLVLASTIANPISDLAAAAEAGRRRNRAENPGGRVMIPDMSARPDEIGHLSGAMRSMVAALYDRIDSNEQFAADVAHEIKNPLSSLRSAIDTLRMAKNDVQRAKLFDVIEHDVRRLDRLVSDISNASRLDAELVREEMEPFNLVRTISNIVSFQQLEARQRGIDFIVDLPEAPIVVHGLEARLAQVFVNLIGNAISFCQEGDAVRIWARLDNRVLIVVEDTGPGIPDGALTKIFSRFYSERPADDFGNHSGLGLAISKQIVEAHGGVIFAENIRPTDADAASEPLGARFVVALPA